MRRWAILALVVIITANCEMNPDEVSSITAFVQDYPTPPPLKLPYTGTEVWWISQGNSINCQQYPGSTHCEGSRLGYAWDFNFGSGNDDLGKPVLAAASGVVVNRYVHPSGPSQCGQYCNGGWGQGVIIDYGVDPHDSQGRHTYGLYAHFDSVAVEVGQFVLQGAQVGTCGTTGASTGAHIHYQTQDAGSWGAQSIPSRFSDADVLSEYPNGVPEGCNCSYNPCPSASSPYCYQSANHYPEFTALQPFNVSKTAGTSQHAYNPDAAMLASGKAYVVWWYSSGGVSYVYSSICNPDSNPSSPNTCSSPAAIGETLGGGVPSVAIDSQNNIHLVYQKGSPAKIYYTKFNGISWSTSACISDPLLYTNNNARIALDASGNPRVVWWNVGPTGNYPGYHIYYNEYTGTVWIGPQQLTYTFGNNGYSIYPNITVDPSGLSHVVLERPQWDFYIYYMFGNGAKENWSVPQAISDPNKSANSPAIASDSAGNLHVTFKEQALYQRAKIVYRKKTSSGWQTTETVSQNQNWDAGYPDIGVDNFGNPHFDWLECGQVLYRRKSPTGWQGIRTITTSSNPNAYSPDLVVDGAGRAHVLWMEAVPPTGAWDIFYRW